MHSVRAGVLRKPRTGLVFSAFPGSSAPTPHFARRRCGFDWSGNQHPVVLHPSKKRGAGLPTPLKSESAGTTAYGRPSEPCTVVALTPLKSEGVGTHATTRSCEPFTVVFPYASKKRGRRYDFAQSASRALDWNRPYAQAGRPPEGRDTTQVSDKFYANHKPTPLQG